MYGQDVLDTQYTRSKEAIRFNSGVHSDRPPADEAGWQGCSTVSQVKCIVYVYCIQYTARRYTVCPRSSYPFYIVSNYSNYFLDIRTNNPDPQLCSICPRSSVILYCVSKKYLPF